MIRVWILLVIVGLLFPAACGGDNSVTAPEWSTLAASAESSARRHFDRLKSLPNASCAIRTMAIEATARRINFQEPRQAETGVLGDVLVVPLATKRR